MIEKIERIGSIEIVGEDKHIQVKIITDFIDDGEIMASKNHRRVISPGDDYSNELPDIQNACQLYHTTEIVAEYQAHVQAQ